MRHLTLFSFFLFHLFVFKTEYLCVVLTALELALYTRLVSNSQRSTCLSLPSAGIKGMCHHCLASICRLYLLAEITFINTETTKILPSVLHQTYTNSSAFVLIHLTLLSPFEQSPLLCLGLENRCWPPRYWEETHSLPSYSSDDIY